MPVNSQPMRTYAFITRVQAAKASVAGKCTTSQTGCSNKNALLTTNKLAQQPRLIDEYLGKLACCNCGSGCKASMTKILGRTPGCGCCR